MGEMQEQGVGVLSVQAEVKCKVFEDNSGALTMAALLKIRPYTKYINTKYWHFREYLDTFIVNKGSNSRLADSTTGRGGNLRN